MTCGKFHILWSKIRVHISYRKYRDSVFHRSISKVRFPYLKHRKFHISCKKSELRFSCLKYTQFICHVRKSVPWFSYEKWAKIHISSQKFLILLLLGKFRELYIFSKISRLRFSTYETWKISHVMHEYLYTDFYMWNIEIS